MPSPEFMEGYTDGPARQKVPSGTPGRANLPSIPKDDSDYSLGVRAKDEYVHFIGSTPGTLADKPIADVKAAPNGRPPIDAMVLLDELEAGLHGLLED